MKERPIIFSGPMVRSILDGRKTQTRRVVKPQPECVNSCGIPFLSGGVPVDYRLCPHGSVGDSLWVRETWSQPGGVLRYRADGESKDVWKWAPSLYMPRSASRITLEITGVRVERLQEISEEDAKAEGVEPIVDNSPFGHKCGWLDYCDPKSLPFDHDKPSASFRSLWQTIHGHGSWDANPWVWVIEFKRNDKLTRDAGTQKL